MIAHRHISARRRPSPGAVAACAMWTLAAITGPAMARDEAPNVPHPTPDQVRSQTLGVGVQEHVGGKIPGEIEFVDTDGKRVLVGDYFKSNKPAIIMMVYYHCPVVCTALLDKVHEALNAIEQTVGKDYQILVFSFDPTETTDDAFKAREYFILNYKSEVTADMRRAWQFHTGTATSARQLAEALGFQYKKLDNGQYSHPVATFVATPDGTISRYFFGWFEKGDLARNLKLSLMDAASGRVSKSLGDKLLSFCYMFDPKRGAYTLQAFRVMQVGGVLTFVALASLVGVYLVGERYVRRHPRGPLPEKGDGPPRVVVTNAAASPAEVGT